MQTLTKFFKVLSILALPILANPAFAAESLSGSFNGEMKIHQAFSLPSERGEQAMLEAGPLSVQIKRDGAIWSYFVSGDYLMALKSGENVFNLPIKNKDRSGARNFTSTLESKGEIITVKAFYFDETENLGQPYEATLGCSRIVSYSMNGDPAMMTPIYGSGEEQALIQKKVTKKYWKILFYSTQERLLGVFQSEISSHEGIAVLRYLSNCG